MMLRPNTAHVTRYLLDGRQRSEITTCLYFEARIIDPYKASLCESLISRETEEVPKRTFWRAMTALLVPTRSMADRTSTFPGITLKLRVYRPKDSQNHFQLLVMAIYGYTNKSIAPGFIGGNNLPLEAALMTFISRPHYDLIELL